MTKMSGASLGSQPRTGRRPLADGHRPAGLRATVLTTLFFLAVAAAPAWGKASPAAPSVVAEAAGRSVAIYHSPYSKKPFLHLSSPTADGVPLVFLVKSRWPGWERVYLPRRPNGSTGWVKDSAVSLALD